MTAPTYYAGVGGRGCYQRIAPGCWRVICRGCGQPFTFDRDPPVTLEPPPPVRCQRCRESKGKRVRPC